VTTVPQPVLIYDGECRFCRYCVDYARAVTGERVEYQPYQMALERFPALDEDRCRAAIQLVESDGAVSSGAGAAFRVLALGGASHWDWLYRTLPLFAALSEWGYRQVAAHRALSMRLCRCLFGEQLRPASVQLTSWLFLRLLALVYLAAFASFTGQASGLIGAGGILPVADFFSAVDAAYGPQKYLLLPSLLWLNSSDWFIGAIGYAGCGLALLLFAGRLPKLCLVGLYLCYLSLYHGGQIFMSFQWDILLLESGFLAILLCFSPQLAVFLYRWLLFRFMLQSGLVKWLSGDPTWRDLTALGFHFQTQPLPTALAWYAAKLPPLLLEAGAILTFVVELVLPFLIFAPRRPRALAALGITLFELLIIATGSYNFFNLLTICLCLLLLDDQFVRARCPAWLQRRAVNGARPACMRTGAVLCAMVAAAYLVLSSIQLVITGGRLPLAGAPRELLSWLEPFHIANGYGVFAVMTTRRDEIIFEGSADGRHWLPYELPYKPGAVDRRPRLATPMQPRLDWQLWFAALAPRQQSPWLAGLVRGLLTGSEPVLALFQSNPFADGPPRYVRASLYRYRFSSWREREESGAWWVRRYEGEFWPVTAWQLPVERTDE
jgi:predicted DCC family thiol-disulfide oxidoreductase YuxK